MSLLPSSLKRSALLAALVPAVLLAGCANMETTAGPAPLTANATLAGNVHGGNQPVSGASVLLYTVGTGGYGTAGTLLATTTTNGGGYFSFSQQATGGPYANTGSTYICPSSTTQTYIIASGGNTQGSGTSTNSAAAFVTALGQCGTSGNEHVDMNEVTTVGTMAALQQFFDPEIESFGYDATSTLQTTGFVNAVATIPNLINSVTGTAGPVSATITGSGTNLTTAATVTITPEVNKINTIANITAACANQPTSATTMGTAPNTTNTSCGTLFANVPAPSPSVTSRPNTTFTAPTDIVQATYYMLANPSGGSATAIANLFALQTGVGAPFQNALSAAPTDWTIGVTYSAPATAAVTGPPAVAGVNLCDGGGAFILYAYDISVDASGNVWIDNGASSTAGSMSSTTEISPVGKPLACTGPIGASRGGAAIDTAGNVWSASGATGTASVPANVYKFNPTSGATIAIPVPNTTGKPYAIRADGSGNVFFTDSAGLLLYELPSTATASTVATSIGTVTGSSPYSLAIDSKGTVVVGQSGAGGSTITAFVLATPTGTTYNAAQALAQSTGYAGVYGIAFDSSDNFWVGNSAGGSSGSATVSAAGPGNTTSYTPITYTTNGTTGAQTAVFGTPASVTGLFAGGLSTARQVAIDGANNVWTPNNTAASSGLYAVTEISHAGVALSPTSVTSTNSTATPPVTTDTQNGGFQKAASVLAGPRGIAIDPSGNVWISNTASTASSNFITEIVGAAVPVVTPLSIATKNGKLGAKP